ncbi:hypothetical protein NPIL_371191 [Nephila pilipes]|uniref:Uncharacterized protein n=1 Tax=Nephila pilipes TaxID=299642 RepID=A0A8X6QVV8_NEPPI|nr:hypothetical protein NPIL_371191 [Nephila pilipes]
MPSETACFRHALPAVSPELPFRPTWVSSSVPLTFLVRPRFVPSTVSSLFCATTVSTGLVPSCDYFDFIKINFLSTYTRPPGLLVISQQLQLKYGIRM